MATNPKIITGLSQADGSPPGPPVFRPKSGIKQDLAAAQSFGAKIDDLRQQKDAKIRTIKNDKDLTQTAVGAQLKAISDVFDSDIESLVKATFAYCDAAAQVAPFFTRQACFLRAVADAAVTATDSMLARLRRESAAQLMDEAALAASRADPVAGGLIMIEVSARTEGPADGPGSAPRLTRGQREAINKLLDTIPLDAEIVAPMLVEFDILRRETSIRAGKGTPTAKIAVALLKQQAGYDDGQS
ncbi:hypothetical protein [Candidatus Binatus soli]|jgi:hypothetical protein|uniref:hypothetical protein n=1 Tax=Candidatus Binatus soli TaxID=1953413 RepID=UPI003D09973B